MMVTALGVIAAVIMLLSVSYTQTHRSPVIRSGLVIVAIAAAMIVTTCLVIINQEEMIYIPR